MPEFLYMLEHSEDSSVCTQTTRNSDSLVILEFSTTPTNVPSSINYSQFNDTVSSEANRTTTGISAAGFNKETTISNETRVTGEAENTIYNENPDTTAAGLIYDGL